MPEHGVNIAGYGVPLMRAHRAESNLPQTAQVAYFRVQGRCKIVTMLGEVTTVIGAGVNQMKVIMNPTVGADTDLCVAIDIDSDAVGSFYKLSGDISDSLIVVLPGVIEDTKNHPLIVNSGTIDIACDASKTGQVKWTILYYPLDVNSSIIPA